MSKQDKSSQYDEGSTVKDLPLIVSPKGCTKRHHRMMYWLDLSLQDEAGVDSKFDWRSFNIDWDNITVEDLMCQSIISRAINNAEANAVVAVWNTRYGMLKGGDYVDDGTDDEVETFFGEIPEELYPDELDRYE